jgi:hypothetical protein
MKIEHSGNLHRGYEQEESHAYTAQDNFHRENELEDPQKGDEF